MSTSPDQPQSENFSQQNLPSPEVKMSKMALIKPILWAVLAIAAIILAGMNWNIVWNILVEFVPLALETVEEALDTLFELVGLSPAVAQIATAYTGFVLALVVFYILLRKSITLTKSTKQNIKVYRQAYSNLSRQWWEARRQAALIWWNDLDWMHKIAAICALILIGIPLAFLLAFALGTAVSMLL